MLTAANELAANTEGAGSLRDSGVSPKSAHGRATSELTFATAPLPDVAEPLDTLIVAGGPGVMSAADDPRLLD